MEMEDRTAIKIVCSYYHGTMSYLELQMKALRGDVYAIVLKSAIVEGALNELLRVFGWSMNVLLSGIVPDRNHDDLPLPNARGYVADGIRGCLCQIRGDWEFYAVVLGMAHWRNKHNMCREMQLCVNIQHQTHELYPNEQTPKKR